MKRKIFGIISLILFVFLCTSGLFEEVVNFFTWLVTLNATQSEISKIGEIFVKTATFVVSYSVVGFLFNALGWFNSDFMKVVYAIVSTIVSFVLCYIAMLFETYLPYIVIVVVIALVAVIITAVVLYIKNRKREKIQSNSLTTE